MAHFSSEPELILDCRNRLGESILWDERSGRLHWANIHDRQIWTWNPFGSQAPEVVTMPQRVGAIGLRQRGGLVVALEDRFALLDPQGALVDITWINAPAQTRLNDGRVSPEGRFLCGGMHEGDPQLHTASLYSLDHRGEVQVSLDGIACTNSLCWSPDGGTLYFTDMPSTMIERFSYDAASGKLSDRRPLASLAGEPGLADGSTVDAEGCLWNAQWGGAKLVRYRPDGSVEREVAMPVANPTCLAFGGPDLDILFVTTAHFGLTEAQHAQQPQAGGLYAFRPGVKGRPEARFLG